MSWVPDLYLESFTFKEHFILFILEWINLYFELFSSTPSLFWLCCVLEGKGFVVLLPFLVMFHNREIIGMRKIQEMGHILLLNVLFIESYQSGLTETVCELTYALPPISNVHSEK